MGSCSSGLCLPRLASLNVAYGASVSRSISSVRVRTPILCPSFFLSFSLLSARGRSQCRVCGYCNRFALSKGENPCLFVRKCFDLSYGNFWYLLFFLSGFDAAVDETSLSAPLAQPPPLSRGGFGIPENFPSSPEAPLGRGNDDDRRQWRKQGVVVGAAASKTQTKCCGCWVPQPGLVER